MRHYQTAPKAIIVTEGRPGGTRRRDDCGRGFPGAEGMKPYPGAWAGVAEEIKD